MTAESDRRLSGGLATASAGRSEPAGLPMIDPQVVVDSPEANASEILDFVVVGGRPAGLTAGLYLRRFHPAHRALEQCRWVS